jgi:hypothetical protein
MRGRAQSAESAAHAVLLGEARAAAAAQDRARAERKLDEAFALLIRHVAGDPNNIDALLLLDHVSALGGTYDLTYRSLRAELASQSGC